MRDDARRRIANATGRDGDTVEKADTALVGLVAQLPDAGDVDDVVFLTIDKPAGKAAETLRPEHGVGDRIEYRYASEAHLKTITAEGAQRWRLIGRRLSERDTPLDDGRRRVSERIYALSGSFQ